VDIDQTRQAILRELDPNFALGEDKPKALAGHSAKPQIEWIDLTMRL